MNLLPKLEPVEIPPSIDDELIVTVRVRMADRDVRDHLADDALGQLVSRLETAIAPLLVPGRADLVGIEIALPDFRPYSTGGRITHEFTSTEEP